MFSNLNAFPMKGLILSIGFIPFLFRFKGFMSPLPTLGRQHSERIEKPICFDLPPFIGGPAPHETVRFSAFAQKSHPLSNRWFGLIMCLSSGTFDWFIPLFTTKIFKVIGAFAGWVFLNPKWQLRSTMGNYLQTSIFWRQYPMWLWRSFSGGRWVDQAICAGLAGIPDSSFCPKAWQHKGLEKSSSCIGCKARRRIA